MIFEVTATNRSKTKVWMHRELITAADEDAAEYKAVRKLPAKVNLDKVVFSVNPL